ncbi:S8 family peptidase [Cryptosporangium phraense]|uniref:S8/S53 family peptidase n=1 Tax=Cryptosporangium phraense TaxID=2593070 RepID=A0A545AIQ0_9ACTN|nr:S8/S53 family peptidase [Cryptosporangium phraense]TQS41188.1 S8/S53 family peptidase [Cryptosporangium phraense]
MSFATEIDQRILRDPAAGRQQAAELARMGRDEQQLRHAQRTLTDRREGLRSEDARHVPIDHLDTGAGPVGLIARGEVLVAGEESATERTILASAGFGLVSGLDGLRRYLKPGAPVDDVVAVIGRLTEAESIAAPNYVIVAGHTVKAAAPGEIRAGIVLKSVLTPGEITAGIVMKTAMCAGGPRPTTSEPPARRTDDDRGTGVRVAVLDTTIDPSDVFALHGLLSDVTVDSPPAVDGPDLDTAAGHGAFVAALVRQVAPAAAVQVLPVLAGDGLGTEYALCEALHRLAAAPTPPHLVNLSLSAATAGDAVPVGLPRALDALLARHPETVVVAAAGNNGSDVAPWPAAHRDVVAVAAVDADGEPAAYSNRGEWVDFSAPADGVVSAYPAGSGFAAWTGTSFAAPQVVGALAGKIGDGQTGPEALAALRAESSPRPNVGHVL